MSLSRRQLLARLGGAGAFSALHPFVPLLQSRARGVDFPVRLVVFQTSMGMPSDYPGVWEPDAASPLRFAAGSVLEPLVGLEQHLLVLNGITLQTAQDQRKEFPGAHPLGLGNLLTAAKLVKGDGMVGGGARTWTAKAGGSSVDQFLANELKARSMVLGVHSSNGSPSATYKTRLSFRGPTEPLAPVLNPAGTISRFWGDVPTGDATAETAAAATARKAGLFNHVRAELGALQSRLGQADREKLDVHLASLERAQLDLQSAPAADCTRPSDAGGSAIPTRMRTHLRTVRDAFACDLARVATVAVGAGSPHGWRFEWLGNPLSDAYHVQSHKPASDAAAQRDLLRANRWYAEEFAWFVKLLRDTPEGAGTMLDNTVVLWCSEVSNGDTHSFQNMPFVIAGGSHYFRHNAFVQCNSAPHNQLMVSICHALGVMTDTFGDLDYKTGPLPGIAK